MGYFLKGYQQRLVRRGFLSPLVGHVSASPLPRCVLLLGLLLAGESFASDAGVVERQIQAFEDSEFIFARGGASNVPFPPLAFIGASHYGNAKVEGLGTEGPIEYNLSSVTQAAGYPWLVGDRDALVVGEYLSWSKFRIDSDPGENFNVSSIGIPLAWLRQVNEQWQTAAFVFPMGHKSDRDDSDWTVQTMGGVFARYVQTDQLWWAFGFYADVGPGDDFYIPYVGATWMINERWTLSGIMPWPALLYAPNQDWLFRFGVSPSGASWSLAPENTDKDVSLNLDAWDLGASVERRLSGGIFASLEAGIGGFRGLRLDGTDLEDADFEVHSSPYIKLDINFRPGVYLQ